MISSNPAGRGWYLRRVLRASFRLVPGLAAVAVAVVISGSVPGCRAPSPGPLDAGPWDGGGVPASVELGTGVAGFVALPPSGAPVELVMGPQGGYHVEVAVRVRGLDLEGVAVTYDAVRVRDGAVLSHTPYVFSGARFVRDGDAFVHTGDLAILSIDGPADVVGQALELRVSVASGTSMLTDARQVSVVDERP